MKYKVWQMSAICFRIWQHSNGAYRYLMDWERLTCLLHRTVLACLDAAPTWASFFVTTWQRLCPLASCNYDLSHLKSTMWLMTTISKGLFSSVMLDPHMLYLVVPRTAITLQTVHASTSKQIVLFHKLSEGNIPLGGKPDYEPLCQGCARASSQYGPAIRKP